MIRRKVRFTRAGPLPIAGAPLKIIGSNPRRCTLIVKTDATVAGQIRLYDNDNVAVETGTGFRLDVTGEVEFFAPCPQNEIYAGGSVGNLFVDVAEVTDEDIG